VIGRRTYMSEALNVRPMPHPSVTHNELVGKFGFGHGTHSFQTVPACLTPRPGVTS